MTQTFEVNIKIPDHMISQSITFQIGAGLAAAATAVAATPPAPVVEPVRTAVVESVVEEVVPVVEPESAVAKPGVAVSLESFYESTMRAKTIKATSLKTVRDHVASAQMFDTFVASECSKPLTALLQAEVTLREQYATWLFKERQNSIDTVTRRLTHLKMIATEMVKNDLITKFRSDATPKKLLQRIRQQVVGDAPKSQRKIPSLDEIKSIAGAVSSELDYPYGQHAETFWRGWIQFCATYGPRCRDVVSVDPERPEKRGLRKQDVHFETLCPMEDVNHARNEELHSPFGWIWYEIGKDHSSDSRRVLLPMSEPVRDWVRYFMELSPDGDDRVFPGTRGDFTASLTQSSMSSRWNKLLKIAGVSKRIKLSEGKGGVIAIRKAAANWWKLQTQKVKKDERLSEVVADYLLHHSTTTISTKHYLSVQASVLPVMIELLSTFPVLNEGASR